MQYIEAVTEIHLFCDEYVNESKMPNGYIWLTDILMFNFSMFVSAAAVLNRSARAG